MKGLAKVAAIDCDDEKNKPTCSQFGVQGFPTLKTFRPSGKKGKPTVEGLQSPDFPLN
jgi:protein disulfide-isomerase A6